MKLLFVDESERNEMKKRYYFVILGAIIDKEQLINLERELLHFKEKNNLNTLKELREMIKYEDSSEVHFKFKKERRLELTEELSEISEKNNIKTIGVIIGPSSNQIAEYAEVYYGALSFMIERFFLKLKKENKKGLIICDSIGKRREKEIKKKVHEFLKEGELMMFDKSKGKFIERIYPINLFLEDEFSSILQLTDLICTSLQSAVWKFINQNNDFNLLNLKGNENQLIN